MKVAGECCVEEKNKQSNEVVFEVSESTEGG